MNWRQWKTWRGGSNSTGRKHCALSNSSRKCIVTRSGAKEVDMAEGYCVKCKAKREMKDPEEVEMKNKRKAMKGTCTKCGTKMFKILGKS